MKGGYRYLNFCGKSRLAHQVSWGMEHGRLPSVGHELHHLCENPQCYRPDHIVELTVFEHRSMHKKGNTHSPRGEANAVSKLTNIEADQLRRTAIACEKYIPAEEVGRYWGVSKKTTLAIKKGERYVSQN